MAPDAQQRAEETLSYVECKIISVIKSLDDPSLLRCVLTHADFHGSNILVNNSANITAALDWEINYIQPAIFSTDYPVWLSDDGVRDPRFASINYWWDESPEERERLRTQFEMAILRMVLLVTFFVNYYLPDCSRTRGPILQLFDCGPQLEISSRLADR
jgi:hypothetical protein